MTHGLKLQNKTSLMESHQGPLRVVYIAGVGRSGSTVLDGVLGNHPLIQSAGELARLASDGWINNFYCSCGKPSQECPFWVSVYEAWCSLNGSVSVQEYIDIQNKVEQSHQLPFLLRERWKSTRTFRAYTEQTLVLLKAIQMVSRCTTIVDSSKGLERAFAFTLIPGIDLKIIQLVRDPRGVVWSHKKAFRKDLENGLPRDIRAHPGWRAALYWCRMNLLANWLRRQVGPDKALLVRYEDFMLDTRSVLERIGNFIGADLVSLQRVIDEGEKLYFGHTIAGNRVRMKGELTLKFDQEWTQKMSPQDRRMTEILSGWLMTRYGYKP